MTPQQALDRSRGFLDEATENLTFAELSWTFEEVWQGVGWALNALQDRPLDDPGLGDKGELPISGSLAHLLARIAQPPASEVVERLEDLRARCVGDAQSAEIVRQEEVEELVFEAWALVDACAARLDLVDPRRDGAASRQPNVERRTALKMLFAGAVSVPLAACSNKRKTASVAAPATETTGSASSSGEPPEAKIEGKEELGALHWPTSDPFLFCAYHKDDYPRGNAQLGPAASLEGRHLGRDFQGKDNWRMYHGRQVPGFPRHPHRGFETVTVVRQGMLDHSDSMGATARYGAGDVQWLTAGGGIQHAEMFPLLRAEQPNPLELFQIWLNLPRADKMVDPHFTMLWSEKIPRVTERDARGKATLLTVAAGRYKEHAPPAPPPNSWGSKPISDLAIWTLKMEPGARFTLPAAREGTHRSLYLHRGGGAKIAGQRIANMTRVRFEEAGTIAIEAGLQETEVLLLQGRPIGEPVAKRGPFVMNTREEIRQAYMDYRRTQFGGWPWRSNDPVHAGKKGRFARHINGSFEEPG